jgi:hypothetical protein
MSMKLMNKKTHSGGLSASMQTVEPKTIAAIVLVVAMLVLWGRVLLRSKAGPAAAKAETPGLVESDTARPAVRMHAVALPVTAGRHDRIAADVFSAEGQWKAFDWNQTKPVERVLQNNGDNDRQRLVSDLTKAITLDAVIQNAQGRPDKASVNGVVVSVGSTISVAVGKEKYSLEVKSIESKQVELAWLEHKIISKMPDYDSGQ